MKRLGSFAAEEPRQLRCWRRPGSAYHSTRAAAGQRLAVSDANHSCGLDAWYGCSIEQHPSGHDWAYSRPGQRAMREVCCFPSSARRTACVASPIPADRPGNPALSGWDARRFHRDAQADDQRPQPQVPTATSTLAGIMACVSAAGLSTRRPGADLPPAVPVRVHGMVGTDSTDDSNRWVARVLQRFPPRRLTLAAVGAENRNNNAGHRVLLDNHACRIRRTSNCQSILEARAG